jgi:ferrous iron transport protein B
LYTQAPTDSSEFHLFSALGAAVMTIPANLLDVLNNAGNPLGLNLGDMSDSASAAEQQAVAVGTLGSLQQQFHGTWGAYAYLLFILLYMPCVATVGAIIKEHGKYWAGFSMLWSFSIAYFLAVSVYQLGNLQTFGLSAIYWSVGLLIAQILITWLLLRTGKKQARSENLIPTITLQ